MSFRSCGRAGDNRKQNRADKVCWEKKRSMEKVATDICLRRPVKADATLQRRVLETGGTKKSVCTARVRPGFKTKEAEKDIGLVQNLRMQMNEGRVKLGAYIENDVFFAWRMILIEETAYSKWKVSGGSEEFWEEVLSFKNEMAVVVLGKFMGYRVQWEKDEKRNYVDETVMHLAQFNAKSGCLLTTTDTEVGWGGQM